MNGFLSRELFIADEDVEMGASRLQGEKICISKEIIIPCLSC